MAVAAVGVATGLRALLTPVIGLTALPFIFYFPAITAVAWYGGLRPAVAAIGLAAVSANWFFLDPVQSFAVRSLFDQASMLAFVASCGFIVAAVDAMHRARAASAQQVDERRRSDALLRTTFASIGDGVIVTDAEGRLTYLNAEAERLTGWSTAEALGQPLSTVFHIVNEATRQPVESPVEKVLRTGGVVGLANHTVLISKQRREIPIDDSGAPIRQDGGPILGVVLVFRDVSAQRTADHTRARLAAIVEHSGDAILTKDLDGIIRTWNAGAERLFGYRPDDVIGQPITILLPRGREHEETEILNKIRQGRPFEHLETTRLASDGREIPISVSVSPIKDRDGVVIGASKIIHDISDIVAARAALAEEKELLATTLASIGDAVIVTDVHGRITFLNGEAERLTRWPADAARGRALPDVFRIVNEQTREVVENPVDKVFRMGSVVGLANHTILIARDGAERPIDDSAAPIRRAGRGVSGVVLVFRDVSDRKRAEEILRETDRRKDEFLAILSHELRNPLAPIRMAVTTLRTLGPRAPELQQLRDVIDRQTSHLARLLDDLMDVSRIGSGKVSLRKDRITLGIALSSAVEAARPLIDAQNHELLVESPREPLEVDGDLGRLAQVFTNLLNNAAKFTQKHGRIEVRLERDGHMAIVRVQDNGIGIDAEQLSHVFEMFAQVDQSVERPQAGLGVGLSLARTFVELHGGRIDARSDGVGKGSEFVVRLPLSVSSAASARPPVVEVVDMTSQRPRRILVADDNADSATVLAAALRYVGHDVVTAHDGAAAIALSASFKPEVAILDIGMPRVSGYDVARRLRTEWNQGIMLVAVTGWGQETDKRRAGEAGFDHHLTKPIDLQAVYRLLSPATPDGAQTRERKPTEPSR